MRIAKYLAGAGIASRRESEKLVLEGRIKVNGKIVNNLALQISPNDRILFDDNPVPKIQKPRIWKYYKPVGLITSTHDEKNRPTVFSNLPPNLPKVISVGRLDINSEGLLLLTNNGDLKRFLELPANGFERTYRVRILGKPTEKRLEPLTKGLTIGKDVFAPMTISIDATNKANSWLTITLREGKNREIRRALNYVGLEVNRLIRTSYGPVNLAPLSRNGVQEINFKAFASDLLKLGYTESELPFKILTTVHPSKRVTKQGPRSKYRGKKK
ncbi:MAG: pseudouridine synthase [Rhodobacteraceae bacterium]|nr:pseudouridine synthase [Paracoccaceae bacterium]